MKIEFQNKVSIKRLSFLCRLPDIKIAWINPCPSMIYFTLNSKNFVTVLLYAIRINLRICHTSFFVWAIVNGRI